MPDTKQVTLPITGMTCANCVATVERNLKRVEGVQVARVNLSSERATVEFDPSLTNRVRHSNAPEKLPRSCWIKPAQLPAANLLSPIS